MFLYEYSLLIYKDRIFCFKNKEKGTKLCFAPQYSSNNSVTAVYGS
jgi:hypothetical protein